MIITVNLNITRVVDGLVKNNGPTRLSYSQLSNAAHGRSANLDVGPIGRVCLRTALLRPMQLIFEAKAKSLQVMVKTSEL